MFSALTDYLRDRIRTEGPLSFRDYMEEVLYHPQFGYYTSSQSRIGFEGDFYTSSDLDPVFGKLLARKFQDMADRMDSFTLVELGAGKGLLARDILAHHRFRYRILERSPALRMHQQELLKGFDVEWIDELPESLEGCIFSNEFFDALPVHRLVQRNDKLLEIYVGENFEQIEGEPQVRVELPPLREGQIVDINLEAREWIGRIARSLKSGFHLVIDYGYLSDEFFAHSRGTLMCYWRHEAHENPYIHIGEQDITAHVNFSDLIDEGETHGLRTVRFSNQKEFLIDSGILDEMQALAISGNAESMQRLIRMKNLILPDRMGERFKVLIQERTKPAIESIR